MLNCSTMFHQLLFLTLACGAFGEEFNSTLTFKQNKDYAFTKTVFGDVEYFTVDGVNILKATEGSHCVAPNDCWEIFQPNQYIIVNGILQGTQAAFTVQPEDPATRRPVTVLYKKVGTPDYPEVPDGASPVFAKESVDEEELIQILLFNAPIGNITTVGNISTTERDYHMISLFGKTGLLNHRCVFFTGHLGTKTKTVVIKFTNGSMDRITINSSNKPEATLSGFTFIDYVNAFKLK